MSLRLPATLRRLTFCAGLLPEPRRHALPGWASLRGRA